jgi:RNA polymerase sigma-70 factor (ECF subfamily)
MSSEVTRSLHRELEQQLKPFVARRVPSPDIDDVLQDVFVRLHRALPELRDEERFGPWMYRVARSAIAEHLRQRARHPLAKGEPKELPAIVDDGDEAAGECALASYLVPLIARLPSPYREALTLTELDGMTQQVASERLGLSISGMKSRVQRGREKLRDLIDECCKVDLDVRGRVLDCEPRDSARCQCRKGESS